MAAAVFLKGSLWFLAHMLVVHNDSQTSKIKKITIESPRNLGTIDLWYVGVPCVASLNPQP